MWCLPAPPGDQCPRQSDRFLGLLPRGLRAGPLDLLGTRLELSRERSGGISPLADVKTGDVHSALFKFLYGRRVDTLAAVLKRHGFSIRDNNAQRAQGQILPKSLYDQNGFGALAEALTSLSAAERAVIAAKAADDRAVVDSLWGDE